MPDPMLEAIRLSTPASNPLDDPALQARIAAQRQVQDRATFLPLVRTGLGVELGWPQAALDARDAVMLPGRTLTEGYQPTDEDILNFALTVGTGGLAASRSAPAGALGVFNRGRGMPSPSTIPPRARPRSDLTGGMLGTDPAAPPGVGHNGGPPLTEFVGPQRSPGYSPATAPPAMIPDPGIYGQPQPANPRYTGAAPDRSEFTFLRYNPAQPSDRVSRSLAALQDPSSPARREMEAAIDRGLQPDMRGQDWYNTEELRDWYIRELGDDLGHQNWAQFMHLMGAASPGSNVFANIGNASMMKNRLAHEPGYAESMLDVTDLKGVDRLNEGRPQVGRPEGYGHLTQRNQELTLARQLQGNWDPVAESPGRPRQRGGIPAIPGVAPSKGSWVEQTKPKGFKNSLMGNESNAAVDLHATRYFAQAAPDNDWLSTGAEIGDANMARIIERFPGSERYITQPSTPDGLPTFNAKAAAADGVLDAQGLADMGIPQVWDDMPRNNEYKVLEDFLHEIGQQRGLTAAQVQAALWMGASDTTGVAASSRGTFMDILRNRAAARARTTGQPVEKVIQEFLRNSGLLSFMPAGVLGGAGLYEFGKGGDDAAGPAKY